MSRDAPQLYARIGGLLYLVNIAAGLFAEAFVRNRIVVPRDAAATGRNIMEIGELSFAVWLTVKGVNLARWREMTGRSAPASS